MLLFRRKLIFILFILLVVQINIYAVDYYVNDAGTSGDRWCTAIGDDNNNGMAPGTPKKTINGILKKYTLQPGDTLYIDKGRYDEDIKNEGAFNGSSTAFITVRGAGMLDTVLNGNIRINGAVFLKFIGMTILQDGKHIVEFNNVNNCLFWSNEIIKCDKNFRIKFKNAVNCSMIENLINDSTTVQVGEFADSSWERKGFWNGGGAFEHVYGGISVGFFIYKFKGTREQVNKISVSARMTAEYAGDGAEPGDVSDVTVLINDVEAGTKKVMHDDFYGEIYHWNITDKELIKKMKIGNANFLKFEVKPDAENKQGLCIYGKALVPAEEENAMPITIRFGYKK